MNERLVPKTGLQDKRRICLIRSDRNEGSSRSKKRRHGRIRTKIPSSFIMKNVAFLFCSMMALHGAVAQVAPVNEGSRSLTAAEKAYVTAIINKIRGNVVYDDPSHGSENPKVVYRVLLLPTGEVMSVDRILESGTPDFDMAVQKGILRASPLPKRRDGQVEHALVIEYSLQRPPTALTH